MDELLTFNDVMVLLHIKKTTMYKLMASARRIPFMKIGKQRLITEEAFQEWLKENEGIDLFS